MNIEEELLSLAKRRQELGKRTSVAPDGTPIIAVTSNEDAEALQAEIDEINRRERELRGMQE